MWICVPYVGEQYGEGHLGRCLLAGWLDSCGLLTLLACMRGRLCHKGDRTIQRSLREARSPLVGLGHWCVHRWYRMYHHGERDNARCVVACGVSVQSLGCFNTRFAVGFQVSMIGGASVMRGIVRMGASSITLCSASRSRARRSASTLCLSAIGGD